MKKNCSNLTFILILLFSAICTFSDVAADTIVITPSMAQWQGTSPKNPQADDIESITGTGFELSLLYKQDVGADSDTGTFAASYETIFLNTSTDPQGAEISFTSGPSISVSPVYLLVKDGNHDPIWYVFNLSDLPGGYSWNGTDTIVLQGFWPKQGAISHVALFGPAVSTPEPSSLLLISTGIVGVLLIRRRF